MEVMYADVNMQVHKAEDEKYADCKSELRREIGQLRGRLLEMIDSNEGAPDLERLDREEFILDMEQHDRLQAEEDQQIQQVSCHDVCVYVPLNLRDDPVESGEGGDSAVQPG